MFFIQNLQCGIFSEMYIFLIVLNYNDLNFNSSIIDIDTLNILI